MQKKLLAVAVLSAFSGVAAAQSANVTLYGTIVQHVEQISATGGDGSAVATGSSTRTGIGGARVAVAGVGVAGVADQSARLRFNPAGTNFGLRGTEDLGNGLSAWFQIEQAVQMGNSAPNAGTNHGTAASYRNTAVGLRSNTWGTVLFGMWDTPFNVLIGALSANGRTGGASTAHNANLFGSSMLGQGAVSGQNTGSWCGPSAAVGVNTAGSSAGNCFNFGTNFDRRERSSIQWWSPNWNGFNVRASYNVTADNGGVTVNNQAGNRNALKQNIWDATVSYSNGPLFVGYGYSRMNDTLAAAARSFINVNGGIGAGEAGGVAGTTGAWTLGTAAAAGAAGATHMSGSTGVGHRLGAKYAFAMGIGIGASWESLKWDQSYSQDPGVAAATTVVLTSLKKTAWRLQGNYTWGSHYVGLDYIRTNALTGSTANTGLATAVAASFDGSGTGSRTWMINYNYALSKRTSLGAYYNSIRNESNANYSGLVFAGIATAPGASPKYLGMQVRHSF